MIAFAAVSGVRLRAALFRDLKSGLVKGALRSGPLLWMRACFAMLHTDSGQGPPLVEVVSVP